MSANIFSLILLYLSHLSRFIYIRYSTPCIHTNSQIKEEKWIYIYVLHVQFRTIPLKALSDQV